MRRVKRMSSAAVLALLTLFTLLLVAPAAAAAATVDDVSPTVTPTSGRSEPMALATTGLDITVPVIIGIVMLVVGIAVVSWAFLRTGSADQRH
ncbi:hypothetical protein SAMN04515671_0228 [Nakamurella panacisegetis]|uniref:LPXTG-motif cell wall anchor domain-containing protein n=1 Tax=Nakamurella panacisegetis TaxID=1090615 RepID=A0A1H0HV51_9ACTN|nr:hypothetical protein [Nakamurella panacisegetis]SDO23037.1 hypothetical protein SAMN04515671_0228 [Nakamurella panacisegetis]